MPYISSINLQDFPEGEESETENESRIDSIIQSMKAHNNSKLRHILFEERSHFLHRKFLFIFISFMIVVLNAVLRGGKNASAVGIMQCSAIDWVTFAIIGLLLIVIQGLAIQYLKKEYQNKLRIGYRFHKADIQWRFRQAGVLSTVSFFCGLLSGSLGIGGGTIYNPLLIKLGKHPLTASSTGMYIVMISSLTSTILFIFDGSFTPVSYYALFISVVVVFGSVCGILAQNFIVARFR